MRRFQNTFEEAATQIREGFEQLFRYLGKPESRDMLDAKDCVEVKERLVPLVAAVRGSSAASRAATLATLGHVAAYCR